MTSHGTLFYMAKRMLTRNFDMNLEMPGVLQGTRNKALDVSKRLSGLVIQTYVIM
jgi:hypothetical protein